MISKTKINQRMKKKTNSFLAEAIFLAKKTDNIEIASFLALPTKKQIKVNLIKLNNTKSNEIVVPGKVLGLGEIEKGRKLKIYALSYSNEAKRKLEKAGSECLKITDALKKLKDKEKLRGEIVSS